MVMIIIVILNQEQILVLQNYIYLPEPYGCEVEW